MIKIYLYAFIHCFILLVNGEFPQVTIDQGVLKGKIQTTFNNRKFYSFTGIPYAKPPIDSYRFEPPQAFGKWEGVYDATGSHPMCLQLELGSRTKVAGDENCLYLNVYTPQPSSSDSELLPVMFYVHGGTFLEGSGQSEAYGPLLLMEKDVVLVTVNYRLGPLGFFSGSIDGVSGNIGLKDQAFALQWVNRNIGMFGGDANKVTIFGHSAGGCSVHFHMFSPMSRDLIHCVIAQSGNAFSAFALLPLKVMRDHSVSLADIVGCKAEGDNEMVRCLKAVPGTKIIKATAILDDMKRSHLFYFGPSLEPVTEGAFLSKHPLDSYKAGEVANVRLMVGITSEDGSTFVPKILRDAPVMQDREGFFEEILPIVFFYQVLPTPTKLKLTKAIIEHYFSNGKIDLSNLSQIIKMCTHGVFLGSVYRSIKAHTKYFNQSAYYYLFDYRGSKTYAEQYNMDYEFGVTHADELLYLFNGIFSGYVPTDPDKSVARLLTTLWTNFAIYGNPTPVEDKSLPEEWKPVDSFKDYYYHIKRDATAECKEGLFTEDAEFWVNLFDGSGSIKFEDEL